MWGWTEAEEQELKRILSTTGFKDWETCTENLPSKSLAQIVSKVQHLVGRQSLKGLKNTVFDIDFLNRKKQKVKSSTMYEPETTEVDEVTFYRDLRKTNVFQLQWKLAENWLKISENKDALLDAVNHLRKIEEWKIQKHISYSAPTLTNDYDLFAEYKNSTPQAHSLAITKLAPPVERNPIIPPPLHHIPPKMPDASELDTIKRKNKYNRLNRQPKLRQPHSLISKAQIKRAFPKGRLSSKLTIVAKEAQI